VNLGTFILTQHIPTKATRNKEESEKIKDFQRNFYDNANARFKDLLDFNNFSIIQEEFTNLS
jgi:hypothetical protein